MVIFFLFWDICVTYDSSVVFSG